MEEENLKSILKTKEDLDMFDEYSKYILIGVMARHGVGQMNESGLAEKVFSQALTMVDQRKEIKKMLEKKKK